MDGRKIKPSKCRIMQALYFICLLMLHICLLSGKICLDSPYQFSSLSNDYSTHCTISSDQQDLIHQSGSFYEKEVRGNNVSCSVNPASVAVAFGRYSIGFDVANFVVFVGKKIKLFFTHKKESAQFVQKYNRWKCSDFEREALKRMPDMQNHEYNATYVSVENQHAILSEYHLYQFEGFRAFIKTLSEYESYIKKLHHTVSRDLKAGKKWWRDLPGFSQQSFTSIVHNLCCQVTDAQQMREKCAQERIKYAQNELHKKQAVLRSQADYLQEYAREYVIDLQTNNCTDPTIKRLRARAHAIAQSNENSYQLTVQSYSVSQQGDRLLRECSVETYLFSECEGAVIQHQIHQELIMVLDQTAAIRYAHTSHQSLQRLTDAIGTLAGLTTQFNAEGYMPKAFTLADCCFAFLDCAKGITEGLTDGCCNTAYAITHPKETIIGMANGVATASWCAGKVLYEICDIRINYLINPEVGEQRLEQLWNRIETVAAALTEKISETPLRQSARAATANLVEIALTKKCLSCMHTFYQGAQKELITVIQNIEQSVQQPLAFAGYPSILIASEAAQALPLLTEGGNSFNCMSSSIIGQIAKNIPSIDVVNPKNSDILKPLARGSTGRTEAVNLTEKLVMEQAMADPGKGMIIKVNMTDPRWHASDGWKKMSWYYEGVEIHYVAQWKNDIIVAVDDFKFKKMPIIGCL
jgi:hypothetical protein